MRPARLVYAYHAGPFNVHLAPAIIHLKPILQGYYKVTLRSPIPVLDFFDKVRYTLSIDSLTTTPELNLGFLLATNSQV